MDLNLTLSPADKLANDLAVDAYNKQLNYEIYGEGRKPSQQLDKDDFLKLLITQLSHQDPTNPMDNTQFIGQMAQFSSLEQMYNMSNGFNKLAALMNNSDAAGTLGRSVEIENGETTVSGVVDGFTRGENPQVRVNGEFYSIEKIKAVYDN